MEIALIGANADALYRTLSLPVVSFPSLAALPQRSFSLLALCTNAAAPAPDAAPQCGTLLLPGDSDPAVVRALAPQQIVGYGLSPRDTLTLSSIAGAQRLLCLQRSLLTLRGTLIEAQELPLPPQLSALPAEQALLLAGIELLCRGRGGLLA